MKQRRYDVDWLRVLAMLVVFYFHSAKFFDEDWFHLKNAQLSLGLTIFTAFVWQWMMPLFFIISGAGTWFSLTLRTGGQYALERLKRLFVPFAFGTLFLIAPQVYLERINRGQFHGSYWQFYPHFFQGIYPKGNFSWHHLWFLVYLFTFSLIALPLFLYLRREPGQRFISRLAEFCGRPGRIFLLAVPLAVIEMSLRPKFAGFQTLVTDWANFLSYITLFIYGFILVSDDRFTEAIARHGPAALALATCTFLLGAAVGLSGHEPERGYSAGFALWMVLVAFDGWFWLIAILWLGRRFLSFTNRFLGYSNEAVLPFYVLHQTVIVIIGFYVIKWPIGIAPKYLVISTASFLAIMAIYDLIVRRTSVTRFLFGMRPLRRVG